MNAAHIVISQRPLSGSIMLVRAASMISFGDRTGASQTAGESLNRSENPITPGEGSA